MKKLVGLIVVLFCAFGAFCVAQSGEHDPWALSDSESEALESLAAKSRALQGRINAVVQDAHKRLERELPALVTSRTQIGMSQDGKRWKLADAAPIGS